MLSVPIESMAVEETLRKLFSKLGLGQYELNAYITLVLQGKVSASELSKVGRIPQSKIYGVLQLLEMRGMVETEMGFPKKYKAIGPQTAAKKIISQKEKQVENLNKEIETALIEALPSIKTSDEVSEEKIWTVIGREETLQKTAELVSRAKKSAYLLTLHFSINDDLAAAIKSAVKRGCDCRIIGFADKETLGAAKKYLSAGIKIRHLKHSLLRFAVIDEKYLCFRMAQQEKNIYTTVWSASPSLARIFSDQYTRLWKEGIDAAPLIKKLSRAE